MLGLGSGVKPFSSSEAVGKCLASCGSRVPRVVSDLRTEVIRYTLDERLLENELYVDLNGGTENDLAGRPTNPV